MYAVSDAWASAYSSLLAPEGFVEISCYIPALRDTLVYTKSDLMSFSHQQTGSLVSGELPKNHIEFSLDNSDGKWNPSNPVGYERYLSERLKITLRYGLDVNGMIEWIPGGVFYLTEWRTSNNSMEASFVARDVIEYMIDKPYTGDLSGTLYEIAERAIGEAVLPEDAKVSISDELKNYSVDRVKYDEKKKIAEILQKCANAAGCVMYQDREGVLKIDKLEYVGTNYSFYKKFAYKYPEIDYSRPMKNVSVAYRDGTVLYQYGSSGETQTVTNDFINTRSQASNVAKWVCDSLRSRKKISGEIRGDPRIDLFDVVDIDGKYGSVSGVVLTEIKCAFSGAFRFSYTGYIRGSGEKIVVYCGEHFAGEVV